MLNLEALNSNELENVVGGKTAADVGSYGYRNGVVQTVKSILPFLEPSITEKDLGNGNQEELGYFSKVKENFGNIDGIGKKAAVATTIVGVPAAGAAAVAGLAVGGYYLVKKYVINK